MKLHDFDLWFYQCDNGAWSTTIPENTSSLIYYDGQHLGDWNWAFAKLTVFEDQPHIIYLSKYFPGLRPAHFNSTKYYWLDTPLTLEHLIIQVNPNYPIPE